MLRAYKYRIYPNAE
ncbi:MAG: helix-turn-helix domain-containing protein, partial [Cyclobacteriaceae bacterium]